MSKIEEMAEKYAQEAYSNPVDRNVGKADFIAGANAVLREIEDVLYSPITPYQLYNDLDKLVKELKGE